jgi:endonuclease/exonuclease/phosphatase family metal-dependent hydrolase
METKTKNCMSILTFNIRFENPIEMMSSASTNWKNRKNSISALLKKLDTDIICIQECVIPQLKFLRRELESKYFYYGALNNNLSWHWSDINAIFYKFEKYKLLNSGTNWFSSTPTQIGSKSYGNFIPRAFNWIILEHKSLRLKLLVMNTHLDVLNPESRIKCVEQMASFLKSMEYEYDLLLLAGDFNTVYPDKNIISLFKTEGIDIVDSFKWASSAMRKKGTFNGFHGDLGRRIDYVFYLDRKGVIESGEYIVNDEKSQFDEFISDHYPVIFNIKFKDDYIKLL